MKRQHLILIGSLTLVTAIVLTVAGFFLLKERSPQYRTITPEKRHVQEVIHANGTVQAGQAVDLSFVRSGRVKTLAVAVGDTVKAGQMLAELDNGTEAAQIGQARAALDQRAAGSTPSQIAIYQAAVDAAQADLDKTKTDTAASVSTAQSAVDAAQNNLKLNSNGDQSQIVLQAYQNAQTALQSSVSTITSALIQADTILGVDSSANAGYASVLSVLDTTKLATAKNTYTMTKSVATDLRDDVTAAANTTDQPTIDARVTQAEQALSQTNALLSSVTDVLHATVSGSLFSQTDLAAKEATIQSTQTGVLQQRAAVVTSEQGITNAKNSLNSFSIALAKAQQDLKNAQQATSGTVKIKQAMLEQAQANLNNAKATVRGVDLAPLQAAVNLAGVSYMQTRIISPIDGVVTKKNVDIGSIASPNTPILTIIDPGTLQTEVRVSEADVSRVKVGDHAKVTLDAYGPDVTFDATIVTVDPAPSAANGVTGYKLALSFAKGDDRIKAGMTSNVSIIVDQKDGALTIPGRSVVQKNGKDVIFILKTGATQPVQQEVTVGVEGDDGYWEIVSGLDPDDRVVDFGN